jgi:hypothetical protein
MNCAIVLDTHITVNQKLQLFKSVLKAFGKQLWEAKNQELRD